MDWKALVMQMSMIALQANPKTRAVAPYIGTAITTTEEMLQHRPAEKTKDEWNKMRLDHAVDLVKLGMAGTNAAKPGTVNEAVGDHMIASAITTVVDASNLVIKNPFLAGNPVA